MYKAWEVGKTLAPVYSGGRIEVVGDSLYCMRDGTLMQIGVDDFEVKREISDEGFDSFATTPEASVCTFSSSGLLKLWDAEGNLSKTWKSDSYVRVMDIRDVLLACGNADGSIRVFHLSHFHLTHKFKNHTAPVTDIKFHPTEYHVAASS